MLELVHALFRANSLTARITSSIDRISAKLVIITGAPLARIRLQDVVVTDYIVHVSYRR